MMRTAKANMAPRPERAPSLAPVSSVSACCRKAGGKNFNKRSIRPRHANAANATELLRHGPGAGSSRSKPKLPFDSVVNDCASSRMQKVNPAFRPKAASPASKAGGRIVEPRR